MSDVSKRVNMVRVKMVKESSMLYSPRKVTSPSDAAQLIRDIIDESDREKVIIIAVNSKNEPTNAEVCSIGSLSASIVHPRECFKMAILSNAASIIIGHNHPSMNKSPSVEDRNITQRLVEVGKIVGIPVLDHLIVTDDDYYSFKEMDEI